jgi:hypothetical protein
MRAAGEPPPEPVAPEGPPPLRLGQAARLLTALGPGDVPSRAEHLRVASRAAAACGGWAKLRGFLDGLDFSTPDARRALRAAVGAAQPKALASRRAWNALRARAPRLPDASLAGIGDQGRGEGEGGGTRRRRRRRRLSTAAAQGGQAAQPAPEGAAATGEGGTAPAAEGQAPAEGAAPSPARRRRRRRRRSSKPAGEAAGGEGSGASQEGPGASSAVSPPADAA